MANSAGDAGHSEREIRRQLIESGAVDVMVAIGTNFFYTVTLPVTLWFLDKGKARHRRARTPCCSSTPATSTARSTAPTATSCPSRSSCSPTSSASTAARTSRPSTAATPLLKERFPDGTYVDVPGLCKVATRAEIEAQGWSLNPGRYTGTAAAEDDDEDFTEKLEELYEEFTRLSDEADELRAKVDAAVTGILERMSEWRESTRRSSSESSTASHKTAPAGRRLRAVRRHEGDSATAGSSSKRASTSARRRTTTWTRRVRPRRGDV